MRRGAPFLLVLALAACRSASPVARVYDGRLVPGRYVTPDAYAAFLRGVLAEEDGDLAGAATAYEAALAAGELDPLVLTRLGAVRCRQQPNAKEMPVELRRALAIDETFAPAHLEVSRCAAARGDAHEASVAAEDALWQDPFNVEASARRVRSDPATGPDARVRAVTATLLFGDRAAAWEALRVWGTVHGDPALVARGLVGILATAPQRSDEVEAVAMALARAGHGSLAATVAGAVADAPAALAVRGPRNEIVARLAVDDALGRGDERLARARATRGRVALTELAARAAALGATEMARSLAGSVVGADPRASGARLVLAALGDDAALQGQRPTDVPPLLAAQLFARRLATRSGADAARAFLTAVTTAEPSPGDPLVAALREDLAKRGVDVERATSAP